jgi:hypothetical protein
MPSSPPTALGGSDYLTFIIQKEESHGTQSHGLLLSFTFFFFPQLPTLFPPGKGPFASLARLLSSTTAFATFVLLSGGYQSAGARPAPFSYSSFYFPLIDNGFD